ncbi:MAG: DHH family phosphoesterase [Sedimentisphaerales bacterium]|nr:DHH family phosphoesterase [Sedimentisphaerales bacterium]
MNSIDSAKTKTPQVTQAAQLLELLRDKHRLLIVLQDNPDPDAIASAVALSHLAQTAKTLPVTITYRGIIGRSENRSLVRYLDVVMYPWDWIDPRDFDVIALVDTQPGTGNNALPADYLPDIIIDHHFPVPKSEAVQYADIRSDYGATATILWDYFRQAHIKPPIALATALIYAIDTDTQNLGPEAAPVDIAAVEELYPLADKFILSKIQNGPLSRHHFQALALALKNTRIYQDCLVASLAEVPHPDIIGEIADLFLREEHTQWVLCFGRFQDKIWISLRTHYQFNHAEKIISAVVANRGTGGGHLTRAGGQIPLTTTTDSEYQYRAEELTQNFLTAVNRNNTPSKSLLT